MYQERPSYGSAAAQAPSPFSPPTLQDSALFSSRVLTLLRLHRNRSLRIYSCPAHSRLSETESSTRQASCCWNSGLSGKTNAVGVPIPGTASAPAEFGHPSTATVIASSCHCPSLCEQAACVSRQTGAWRCSMRLFPKPLAICCL